MKTKLIILFLFITIISNAQISTLGKPTNETKKNDAIKYDSLSNFIPDYNPNTGISSYKHLINQKVYVVNNGSGYYDRLKKYTWHGKESENEDWNLSGKYLTIIDIGKRSYNDGGYWENAHDIAFKDETTGLIYCFDKKWCKNINNSLVVVGHFEKMKQLYEGKELVFVIDDDNQTDYGWHQHQNGIFDLNTRKRVLSIKKGTRFLCTGVSIDDQNGNDEKSREFYKYIKDRVVILLHNDELGDFYCYATSQDMLNDIDKAKQKRCKQYILGKFLFSDEYAKKQKNDAIAAKKKKEEKKAKAEEAQAQAQERKEREQQRIQALVDKYGQSNVNLARQGKVKIGWNKELCKEAWGSPRSVNKTTTAYGVHEQWVYSTSRYLYFDDGVLTAIQE